jgi:hypothetical protein
VRPLQELGAREARPPLAALAGALLFAGLAAVAAPAFRDARVALRVESAQSTRWIVSLAAGHQTS